MGALTAPVLRGILCLGLVASTSAAAQVICPGGASTWTGATSNDWRTASNWSPAGVPGNGADVCFSTPNPTPALAGGPPPRLGTIYILAGTNLVLTSAGGSMFLGGGISSDGTFTLAGTRTLLVNAAQTWALGSGSSTINWQITFQSAVTISGAGDLTLAGAIAGGARITKTSTGTLSLDGTGSTHAGGLTINAGVLSVIGTLTAEGTVGINSGATLSGTGTLRSSLITVASGGVYSPGVGGAGTLSTNALTLSNASNVSVTAGTSTTRGAVTGALTLDGVLNITAGSGFGQGTYTIFTASGAITNNSLVLGSFPSGFSYDYQVSGGSVLLKVGPPATAVDLVEVEAVSSPGATEVTWEAGTEIRNLGYRVYREEGGQRVPVSGLIAGSALRASVDPLAGRSYSFVDSAGHTGARYWIESIDVNGTSQWSAQVQSQAGPLSGRWSSALVANLGSVPALLTQAGPDGQIADPVGLDRAWSSPSLLDQWRVAASSGAVKLLVQQDGVYRVSADQLIAAGFPVKAALASLQLWAGGRPVAFRAVSADGSTLQSGDALEFFGQAADTRYTGTRVYWVTHDLGAPTLIGAAPPTNASAPATSFLETLEVHERSLHISSPIYVGTDGFFGKPIIGTQPLNRIFSTPALDLTACDPSTLEVSVQGLTFGPHTLDVRVNGTSVGTLPGANQEVATASFTLAPGTLVAGDNTVTLVGESGTEITLELSQRLTYPRLYTLTGPLRFTAAAGSRVELSGANPSDVHVLDITSAFGPSVVTTAPSSAGVSLTVAGPGHRILYGYRDEDVLSPTIVADIPSSWHAHRGADLVIVGPRSLLPVLQPLADQRTRDGLAVAVVDIQDVYDEFSAGEKDATALRSFLAEALQRWTTAPRFVLLAGAATYDPRGWLGHPELDQVPTILIATRFNETASDDALVTFGNSQFPDLAVGRLPLSTPADMDAAVAKILGRKLPGADGSLLLVRDRDGTIDFSAASAEVRAALPTWNAQDLVRGADDSATHAGLLDALNSGPVAVDYQGHGVEDLWNGRVLSTTDSAALSGSGRTSLFVAATCLNAYFIDIGRESLGAALLRTPGGGAWGLWASSALTLPADHPLLSKTLLSAILDQGKTLGEATLEAKGAVTDPDVRTTFHLLGDPSARAVATQSSALPTRTSAQSAASGCGTPGDPMAALTPVVLAALAFTLRRRSPTPSE
jgi:autotransporter-associated beta strand protein